jgi:hypothetical protein
MWPFTTWNWATTMIAWLIVAWASVLATTWIIFRTLGGPRHHAH